MCFQRHRSKIYGLSHYHHDVFSWLLTRDEDVRLGRFPDTRASFYLLSFKSGDDPAQIEQVVWVNDSAVPSGETFRRHWPARQDSSQTAIEGPA